MSLIHYILLAYDISENRVLVSKPHSIALLLCEKTGTDNILI